MPRRVERSEGHERGISGEKTIAGPFLERWTRNRWAQSFGIFGAGFLTGISVAAANFFPPESTELRTIVGTVIPIISAIGGTVLAMDNVAELTRLRGETARQHLTVPVLQGTAR